MESQNPEVTIAIITSAASILGVILGAGISAFINWRVKTKETKLRIQEKVFDRRIKAHEDILRLSQLLRTTISTKTVDDERNVISYPASLHSDQTFEDLQWEFYQAVNFNSHWLHIELFRELNFVQDYLSNLNRFLQNKEEENYPSIAVEIKQDFIDLAVSLEKKAMKFFRSDIYDIELEPTQGHHKYEKEETLQRLNETALLKLINKSN